MPRVIGIDPGTVSIDVCGLDDGQVFLDRSLPTIETLAHPSVLVGLIDAAGSGPVFHHGALVVSNVPLTICSAAITISAAVWKRASGSASSALR